MVFPEIQTLFSLKIPEDLKWLIYDTLWKQVYSISHKMKVELKNKSLFYSTVLEYKRIFNHDSTFSESIYMMDDENIERSVTIINTTYYTDAMLFDVQMYLKNTQVSDEVNYEILPFSFLIHDNSSENDENDVLEVTLMLIDLISEKAKFIKLFRLWCKLSEEGKRYIHEKITNNVDIFHPLDNIINIFP